MRWMWDTEELWIDPARLAAGGHSTKFTGTAGDDRLVGTDGRDTFDVSQGGDDVLRGKDGNDTFSFGAAFTHDDVVYGGAGHDKITIAGDYVSSIELDSEHLRNVERIAVDGDRSYSFVVDDGFESLRITGKYVSALRVDASALASGNLIVVGSGSADIIIGGAGNDKIYGGQNISQGAMEVLSGGLGNDKFIYETAFDSPENAFLGSPDLITDFSAGDVIILPTRDTHTYRFSNAGSLGDITLHYDAESDRTEVRIVAETGSTGEILILLAGQHLDLRVDHGSHLVI